MTANTVTLNDSNTIPQVGLGVWQARDGAETSAVKHALSVGYRHIDTAAAYRNEQGVGAGIQASGLARGDIFLTSKIWNDDIRSGRTAEALDQSLDRLSTDYLDLILLHWPVDGRIEAWKTLAAARDAGKVRSIGVSNFTAAHLEELLAETGIVPALNQIEYHPYLRQLAIVEACQKHSIAVEAWSPLMQGHFLNEPVFAEIAGEQGKTQAQVVLRWATQHEVIVIPKSVTPERIEENLAIDDFELSDAQMAQINALERGHRFGPDPDDFNF